MRKGISVVDLFCGAGGLTHGFVMEGFRVLAGVDTDKACKYPFEKNNAGAEFIASDVRDLSPEDLAKLYPEGDMKVLVGCAPCQPFSSYTNGDRKKDGKWRLLYTFADLIKGVDPEIFSMENVPDLVRRFGKDGVYSDFVESLSDRYEISAYVVHCPEYGIPQRRTRLVLFGSKRGKVELIPPSHDRSSFRTVRDAIGHLPPLSAGEVDRKDPLHRAPRLSETNLERIKQSKPGGTWQDWDEDLVAKCHRKKTGTSYLAVYGRMRWDEPAPTMTTLCFGYGNGRFGHPDQDRAISLREAAIFQTFPEDYSFVPPGRPYYFKVLGRLIGNAVPVDLGRLVAKSIAKHLEETA
ncbi:DNA-cytosine methyltransferase [Dethiosulfovibrio peptidovorans DSM 11002]|uniref:Cytosine-specific methyltransferase n=1 Tax=Dethiosulfovibrio peptidovorans DSM 11002 TaxID=469381 RepID=D2Z3V7_9BACT|nr:DNA cytosine methyltransferase [Dethiosulfovibrio peptidovorans]EFC90413.1 DNA-cytosine methyltransferase [Dethiosulfovibrio peptidovorans DSM 11002]